MDPKRSARLLQLFRTEMEEHLALITAELLALEQEPANSGRVDPVLRSLHTLKGSARALAAADIETITHRLEDLLVAVKQGERQMTPQLVELSLKAVDALRAMKEHPADGQLTSVDLAVFLKQLEDFEAGKQAADAAAPAATPVAAAPPETPARGSLLETIRVNATKLDVLMNRVGELAIARIKTDQRLKELTQFRMGMDILSKENTTAESMHAQLQNMAQTLSQILQNFSTDIARMAFVSREMEEQVRSLRLLPFSEGVEAFHRLVRDVSRSLGKEVSLVIDGGDTQIDKGILESLKDAILHLLNNAIDHGIEQPSERLDRGKPRESRLVLRAVQRGVRVIVDVSDDGRGIDVRRVRDRAVQLGLATRDMVDALSEGEALDYLFKPGFSTATTVSRVSGRGVGMDVVRELLNRLSGTIEVKTVPGAGTTVSLSLPLTVITTQALLVRVREQLLAIPIAAVERTLQVKASQLRKVDNQSVLLADGMPLPVVPLASVLRLQSRQAAPEPMLRLVVLAHGPRRIAYVVDEIEGEQEVVHKNLGRQYQRVQNVAGATILGTGRIVIILNPADLVRNAFIGGVDKVEAANPAGARRVLLVENSAYTRNYETEILEQAGFQVLSAPDGVIALQILSREPVDVLVTDIAMPRMDGLALIRLVRQQPGREHLPIVVVSAMDSPQIREDGMAAGANVFVLKSEFETNSFVKLLGSLNA